MGKQTWKTVNIPSQLYDRIKRVHLWLGFSSVAEYVREAVRGTLRRHELYVDELEERKEKEILGE